MTDTEKLIKESTPWARLAIAANIHLKSALLGILHNTSNDPTVNGLPSDPGDLYTYLQKNKKKIDKTKQMKNEQNSILFPPHGNSVESSKFDITIIRFLIQTFCNIKNAKGKFDKPDASDITLCAYVYRAADMRNKICHYADIQGLDDQVFEDYWKEMKSILKNLKYAVDIEPERTAILAISQLQREILKEFQDHLQNYKQELSNTISPKFHIERRFSVSQPSSGDNVATTATGNNVVTNIEQLIKENDRVMIYADAGVGKTATARKIQHDWCKEKILNDFNLIYFNSKTINKKQLYNSHIAPLFFSELGDYLKGKGKSSKTLVYHDIVTMKIDNLIVLVDGIDELPIGIINQAYIDELEIKVSNNKEITALDTINAIYFGFLFPFSKVCLLGRVGEFERLKNLKSERESSTFNEKSHKIKDLELLKFDDANVRDFTCFKICGKQQPSCSGNCHEIHENIKDIEICKIPTDLNSLLKLYKKLPSQNIGRITRTKLIIANLINRLNEHTEGGNYSTFNTFKQIKNQGTFDRHLECIRSLGEVSFKALLQDNITIQVDEDEDSNGVVIFTYEDQIKVERKTLEELDFFYVRNFDYNFTLEPYHTLYIEFFSACYFFAHPDEWTSIFKLNVDRQLVIFQFIAGLHCDDLITKDFAEHALNFSDFPIDKFFNWLYTSHDKLPTGKSGYECWLGISDQKLSPSIFFLNSISNEVKIPQAFIPSTFVFFDAFRWYPFEWNEMKYFPHNFLTEVSDNFNLESFLKEFPNYRFLIETDIVIYNNDEFDVLNRCNDNSRVAFKINNLYIKAVLQSNFISHFKIKSLYIERRCDSRTVEMLCNALLPTLSNSFNPFIQCNHLLFFKHLNAVQTETLFNLGVTEIVDCVSLRCIFFKEKEVEILTQVELNLNKVMNIEWCGEGLKYLFDLPNLSKRHLAFNSITNISDEDLIRLSQQNNPSHTANLSKYKIIDPSIPFVRKRNHSLDSDPAMYLNFYRVDFTNVSPEVFANVFSSVPSVSLGGMEQGIGETNDYILESHWSSLSQKEDCLINEIRIWYPHPKNYKHFFNIKANTSQFISWNFELLLHLLHYIKENPNIQSDRRILRVFIAGHTDYYWTDYQELSLLITTIEKFKSSSIEEYSSNLLKLENAYLQFSGVKKHWCCEISLPSSSIEEYLDHAMGNFLVMGDN